MRFFQLTCQMNLWRLLGSKNGISKMAQQMLALFFFKHPLCAAEFLDFSNAVTNGAQLRVLPLLLSLAAVRCQEATFSRPDTTNQWILE